MRSQDSKDEFGEATLPREQVADLKASGKSLRRRWPVDATRVRMLSKMKTGGSVRSRTGNA
jgi:hypothetical protein